jgi:uncharacterized protein
MNLKDRIVADMTRAMKEKDAGRLSTLRMTKAALMNEENKKGVGHELTDDEIIKMLQTLVKQRRDSAEQYSNAGRSELAAKEQAEIAVLEEYLPLSASTDDIDQAVETAVAETGATSMKEMGLVMKTALAHLQGKTVDGKLVSEAVRSRLS